MAEIEDYLSRRTLLAGMASFGAAAGAGPGYIDAHVHVWTPDTKRFPHAEGYRDTTPQPLSFTPEELFQHARPCGVSRVVLIQMSFYRFDNSYMLWVIENYKGVFSGVGIVDQNAAHPEEAMKSLAARGVRGFRISPGKDPVGWLDGPGMVAMWKYGAEGGLAMCPLLNPNALPAVDRMCGRFPETPVVIDHIARIGAGGEVREEDIDTLCRLARHKNVHVKVSAFYALGGRKAPYTDMAPVIRRVRDAFGAERLMWASDCPFQVQGGHTYAASVELVRDRLDFLSSSEKEWILRKTAEKVFYRT